MDMEVSFPGGDGVDVSYNGLTVKTAQDGSEPAPFHLFFASIAACVGFYVMKYVKRKELPFEGVGVKLSYEKEKGSVDEVDITINVPEGFPEKERDALVRVANACAVKKHINEPPIFNVEVQ